MESYTSFWECVNGELYQGLGMCMHGKWWKMHTELCGKCQVVTMLGVHVCQNWHVVDGGQGCYRDLTMYRMGLYHKELFHILHSLGMSLWTILSWQYNIGEKLCIILYNLNLDFCKIYFGGAIVIYTEFSRNVAVGCIVIILYFVQNFSEICLLIWKIISQMGWCSGIWIICVTCLIICFLGVSLHGNSI